MNLNQIYNLIPSENDLIKILTDKNKLCTVLSTDDNLIKITKSISEQIIDFVLNTPIIEFGSDDYGIDGIYTPSIKDAVIDKKFSYDIDSNHIVDNIFIEDLKKNIHSILSTIFNCKVKNTQFKYNEDGDFARINIRIIFL